VDTKRGSYYDKRPHDLRVLLFDDEAWPRYYDAAFTKQGLGSLCIERMRMASFQLYISPTGAQHWGEPFFRCAPRASSLCVCALCVLQLVWSSNAVGPGEPALIPQSLSLLRGGRRVTCGGDGGAVFCFAAWTSRQTRKPSARTSGTLCCPIATWRSTTHTRRRYCHRPLLPDAAPPTSAPQLLL